MTLTAVAKIKIALMFMTLAPDEIGQLLGTMETDGTGPRYIRVRPAMS